MMKSFNIKKIKFLFGILFILPLFLVSCEDEDEAVQINSVWTNQVDVDTHQITSSFTGLWVRLEGSGFNGLQTIYCNGVVAPFTPTFITDNYITFQIPSTVPTADVVEDESVRNTIQVVTDHGSAVYKDFIFKDKNKIPTIKSVSYTMPKVGDYIYLDGSNLTPTTEVYFPSTGGEVKATNFSIVNSTRIKVQVPDGAGAQGAVRVVCYGDNVYSPAYMFYNKGVFIKTFTEDVMSVGGSSNVKIYSNATEIAAATGLQSNPDYILAIPTTPSNVPVAPDNNTQLGHFKFWAKTGFQNVINNSGGDITSGTSLTHLAIQFDLYMNQSWKSGDIALRMNKNGKGKNGAYIYNIAPWTTSKAYAFDNGWVTITVPFNSFTGLSLGTLGDYITTITNNNYEQLFGFFNWDENEDGHTPSAITNFQLYVANVRLVPTTTPASN